MKRIILKQESNIEYHGTSSLYIDIEEYLYGCVAQEIGGAPPEALKAQAVAARTNAYRVDTLTDNSSKFQAYNANKSKWKEVVQAVDTTKGEVLKYNGKLIEAAFSASNGGHTVSSQWRWGGFREYLQVKEDPYSPKLQRGHGVGLSQLGAIEMAKRGMSYRQILQFYYPGTTIEKVGDELSNKESKADIIVNWCTIKIGCGYVWGATGKTLTQPYLDELAKSYPNRINISVVNKWIGKQVFDCATFSREAFRKIGIELSSGASSQWKKTHWMEKGAIAGVPQNRVCLLYRESKDANPMQHVGVYLGNGYVIDARGSNSGVIRSKLGSYPWTHWAIPVGLYETHSWQPDKPTLPINFKPEVKSMYEAKVTAATGSTVRMRSKPDISGAIEASIPVGTVVKVIDDRIQNEFLNIEHNGKTGWMMDKYLIKLNDHKTWYVRVEVSDKNAGEQLVKALNGASLHET